MSGLGSLLDEFADKKALLEIVVRETIENAGGVNNMSFEEAKALIEAKKQEFAEID